MIARDSSTTGAAVRRKVVVVGQGYVGLPLAVRAAEVGMQVIGLDVDARRIALLEQGRSPVEDIPDHRLEAVLESGNYVPTSDASLCGGFDFAVISVPTPLREGIPDLSFIEEASSSLSSYLTEGATVILESTTYPGTTEDLVGPVLAKGSGLRIDQFHLGYSPERIDPGNKDWRLENTPKVVSGSTPEALEAVMAFYGSIVEQTVPVSGTREAELTKLLENTFRHVNIALVNELAVFAHDLGIDVWEAIDAATTKPFGYMRFTPGPGVGGHCLPIDPSYLSWQVRRSLGRQFRFVELANDINDHMPDYVVERITLALNRRGLAVNGQRILLLGLSYKRNTGDARESPSRPIAEKLVELGATVVACDPHVDDSQIPLGVMRVKATAGEFACCDLAVLLVDHDDFDLRSLVAEAGHILDTRHCLQGPNVEHL